MFWTTVISGSGEVARRGEKFASTRGYFNHTEIGEFDLKDGVFILILVFSFKYLPFMNKVRYVTSIALA